MQKISLKLQCAVLCVSLFFLSHIATSLFAQRIDTFDAGQTFQTIDHFGAHDSWTGQVYGSWSEANRQAISAALFSRENGIGLSGWYYNLAAGVDAGIASRNYPWSLRTQETFETGEGQYDWSRNQATGKLLADAKAHGVNKYIMAVYSPPKRITKSGNPFPDPPGGNNLENGFEQQFATYIADAIEHFKNNPDESQRVDFDYVSPLNEPQYNWSGGGQEGNGYLSPANIRSQISTLYDTLQDRGLDAGIRSPESGSIQAMYQGQDYIDSIAKNNATSGKLDKTLAYHSYFSDSNGDMLTTRQQFATKMAELPGWEVWQTEYCILGNNASSGLGGNGNDLTMTTGLAVARTMHFDLSVANTSAWSYWLAATPYEHNYKDGLIYFNRTSESFEVAKVGWVMAHYSRFLRPGTKRIGFSGPNDNISGLLVSGYRNDDSQELILVYANQLNSTQAVEHNFNNSGSLKDDYFNAFVTTDAAGVSLQDQGSFLIGQQHDLPARSMVTLVSGTFDDNNTGKEFDAIVGSRDYTLGSGLLTLTDGQGTYSGSMDGNGGLIKRGLGEWLISENQTYTGQTVVEEGTLALAGSNLAAGRIGRDSELVIRDQGTVRVDAFNALGGFNPDNIPHAVIEPGGELTISDGYTANLWQVTLSGGTLGGGVPNDTYGNWTINNGVEAVAGVSQITAPEIQLRGQQIFQVAENSELNATGLVTGLQGTAAALIKTGGGALNVTNVRTESLAVPEGLLSLQSNGQRNVAVVVEDLDISNLGALNIGEDDILVDYQASSPIPEMAKHVVEGRMLTGGLNRQVAIVENADLGWSNLDGFQLDDTTLLVRSALSGDFNLDDAVDSLDVQTLIDNYGQDAGGWLDGDGNYDGTVGILDIIALQKNYVGPSIESYAADQNFINDWNLALNGVTPSPAQWVLIDDFEGHTAGTPIVSLTTPVVGPGATWTGDPSQANQHTTEVDPSDSLNLAMCITGAPGNAISRAEFTGTSIAAGATGTLFYRFRTPVAATGTTDHAIGLTDNNAITSFNFKSGLRNTGPAGVNNMDIRDGFTPGYESVASLADNTWYSVWMVSTNTNPGTFEIYLQSDADASFATQTQVATVPNDPFDYVVNGATGIVNVYFRNANNTGGVAGNDLYFDDIYINPAASDLTDPTTQVVLLGDVNLDGLVDFLDISPFIAILSAGSFQFEADCDENGVVSFTDISPFIAILSGS